MTLEQLVKKEIEILRGGVLTPVGLNYLKDLERLLSKADKPTPNSNQPERRQIAIQIMASMVQSNNLQSLQYLARRSVLAADEILKALEDESND